MSAGFLCFGGFGCFAVRMTRCCGVEAGYSRVRRVRGHSFGNPQTERQLVSGFKHSIQAGAL